MTKNPTRRTVLAVAGALPIAAALPSAIAAPSSIDAAGVATRLNQVALRFPEVSARADAIIADIDHVLHTDSEPLFEMISALERHTGKHVSLDWMILGEGEHPNGAPHRMIVGEEPDMPLVRYARMESAVRKLSDAECDSLIPVMKAVAAKDYSTARRWAAEALALAGKTVAQI